MKPYLKRNQALLSPFGLAALFLLDVIFGHEIVKIARRVTGYSKKVATVGKGMITFLGLFHKGMREMVEMMYLNEEPVVLSGEKYDCPEPHMKKESNEPSNI
ncbi:hypothetical protein [Geobacillus sp. Geo 8.1]